MLLEPCQTHVIPPTNSRAEESRRAHSLGSERERERWTQSEREREKDKGRERENQGKGICRGERDSFIS